MNNLERIIAGGQVGADQAGLRVARAFSIPTGGWAPRGWATLAGPAPWLGSTYGLWEHHSAGYPPRTRANVRDSDATLWFGDPTSPGAICTFRAVREFDRPSQIVASPALAVPRPEQVARWIEDGGFMVVNIAGSREQDPPWVGEWVEGFLGDVFRALGFTRGEERP